MSNTNLQVAIPAYAYKQYQTDDNIQSFFGAYNTYAQSYLDFFNNLNLPIYPLLGGPLLDWVGQGLYGITRPIIVENNVTYNGLINTYQFNTLEFNQQGTAGSETFIPVTDDIYQRCITWQFYKGDGRNFTIPWLKNRIMRFLTCANGIPTNIDDTSRISVTFGNGNQIDINLVTGLTYIYQDSAFNMNEFNTVMPNSYSTITIQNQGFALGQTFIDAVYCGVLELPFQFTYVVGQRPIGVKGYYNLKGGTAPLDAFILDYNVLA